MNLNLLTRVIVVDERIEFIKEIERVTYVVFI